MGALRVAAPAAVVGAELRQAGLEPGPRMGQVLRDLQDWWMARDFPEEGLDAKLAELIGAGA